VKSSTTSNGVGRRHYQRYAELIARGSGLAVLATAHRDLCIQMVRDTPDGTAALVVSHGDSIAVRRRLGATPSPRN
jgi:hypothetical protein